MPLVKDFIEGSVSDKTYTSELHPKVVNSSKSPLDSASDKIQQQISDHINMNKNLQGIYTQAGGNKREYLVMDNNVECPLIVSKNSKIAAKIAFDLIHNELNIKKRKLIIWDVRNSRRYKYSLIKGILKREKL